jgi:hypothetical protein
MSRRILLEPDAIVVRYGGADALLTLVRELRMPYEAIASVTVGAADAPGPLTLRRIGLAEPITGTRRGRFWADGKKWFLDLRHPARAVVLRLRPGGDFDAVALETDLPEPLADALRERMAASKDAPAASPGTAAP